MLDLYGGGERTRAERGTMGHQQEHSRSEGAARYHGYLLRLWQEHDGGDWRCQVHCVNTGQEWRFAGLDKLSEFLHTALAEQPPGMPGAAGPSAGGTHGQGGDAAVRQANVGPISTEVARRVDQDISTMKRRRKQ